MLEADFSLLDVGLADILGLDLLVAFAREDVFDLTGLLVPLGQLLARIGGVVAC